MRGAWVVLVSALVVAICLAVPGLRSSTVGGWIAAVGAAVLTLAAAWMRFA